MTPRDGSPEYFESAKTRSRIPIAAPLIKEALIQFSLDPAVRSIDLLPNIPFADANPRDGHVRHNAQVRTGAIVLIGDATRELLDFPETPLATDVDATALTLLEREQKGLAIRRITTAELRREPRAGNCRMVWACRNRKVIVDDRVRLLEFLDEEGPLPLSRAAAEMRFVRGAISAVLAMACSDLIELDLGGAPLGPKTQVRRRSSTFDNQE